MSKIIRIDKCQYCPCFMGRPWDLEDSKDYCSEKHKYYINTYKIPEWCPLEEAK